MLPTIQALTRHIVDTLASTIRPLDQRWFEARLLVGHVVKQDQTWVALHPDVLLTQKQLVRLTDLVHRRCAHEPLAYLFEEAPFFGRTFFVDARVLVPRPESERLVELALAYCKEPSNWALWDVGTGSGCLALSIAGNAPQLPVLASDVSPEALRVAKKNARILQIPNVSFSTGSLLTPFVQRWLRTRAERHWCIVANLPYLPLGDRKTMPRQVTEHEPAHALFAEEKGLSLINELLLQLQTFLHDRSGDCILLEHDPRQAISLAKRARELFPHARVTTERDQNQANRFTVIQVLH